MNELAINLPVTIYRNADSCLWIGYALAVAVAHYYYTICVGVKLCIAVA